VRVGPLLAAALAACAHVPPGDRDLSDAGAAGAAPRALAVAGMRDLLRNDAARAARRASAAVGGDPADPWGRWLAAALARRELDEEAERAHLLEIVSRAPGHPLASPAARRLGELAAQAPGAAEAVAAGLEAALRPGGLSGLAAVRARVAAAQVAESLGDAARGARHRAGGGAITAWALLGPCSPFRSLDLDRPFAPELGPLPARLEAPPGLPEARLRELPAPDGIAVLDAEPPAGDVYYLAADVELERGGSYLAVAGATGSLRLWVDGAPVAERRADSGWPPAVQAVRVALGPGRHRLLAKAQRGGAAARVAVALAREDGAPSDARSRPAAAEAPAPAARPGPLPRPVNAPRDLAAALEPEAGFAAARLVAGRDATEGDREAAKALLEEALARLPDSAELLAARARAHLDDPALGERVGRARAEAALDRALALDPGGAAARLERAELMRGGERADDAAALLAALPAATARRPAALLGRARLLLARGFAEGAEALAAEAHRLSGSCAAAEILYAEADRRDAASRADELAAVLARCPGGRARLADHLRRRGDAAGSRDLLAALAREAPGRVERRLELARALVALGDPAAAGREVAAAAALAPRDARLEALLGDHLELAGDAAGARAARERALRLDPADLRLRRALGLEDGREPLQDLAEDGDAALAAYRKAAPREDTSAVYVLDQAAVEAWGEGAYGERVHQVVALLDQRAVDRFGEVQAPQGAQVLAARTLKRDGRVLEAEPHGEKATLSLPGLEPGDFAEWEWIAAQPGRGPALPGFTADTFYFRSELPMWRSAYAVAAPRGTGLRLDGRRLEASVEVEGGREVVRVAREREPPVLPEPGAPGGSEYLPSLQVGAGAGPEAMAWAAGDALADCCRPSQEVVRLAREVEASVPPAGRVGEPLVRAALARAAALVQGQGGGFAETASQVLARGRGNRLLLLKAVLDVLGVRARIALARDFARDPAPSPFPRTDVHSIPLLLVEHGGRAFWLDPSARQIPFGAIPPAARGGEAWVLPAPGESPRLVPVPPGGADQRRVEIVVRLRPDGAAAAEGVERWTGYAGAGFKASLERADEAQRRRSVEQALGRSFPGAHLEALSFEGEGDAEAPLLVRWTLAAPGWARAEEGRLVADSPPLPARLSARFAQRGARETPLLLGAAEALDLRLEVVPPPGFRAAPRPAAEAGGRFGAYRRAERAEGSHLVREDRYRLERGRVLPGDFDAFQRFAAALDEAQAAPMAFPGAPPGVAGDPIVPSPKWSRSRPGAEAAGGHAP
jgi:hypothetical protein